MFSKSLVKFSLNPCILFLRFMKVVIFIRTFYQVYYLPPCHYDFLLWGFILFFCLERFPLFRFDGMVGAEWTWLRRSPSSVQLLSHVQLFATP